jgi:hypothetical protein
MVQKLALHCFGFPQFFFGNTCEPAIDNSSRVFAELNFFDSELGASISMLNPVVWLIPKIADRNHRPLLLRNIVG